MAVQLSTEPILCLRRVCIPEVHAVSQQPLGLVADHWLAKQRRPADFYVTVRDCIRLRISTI